jgi:protein involved in polysaccharide export with SLBB domain
MKPNVALAFLAVALAAFAAPSRAQDQSAADSPAPSPPAPSFNVTIEGRVLHPGRYAITANYTVIDAIEVAGGFTDPALRTSVKVTRASRRAGEAQVTILDYSDVTLKESNANFKLEPNDVISVPTDPTYNK